MIGEWRAGIIPYTDDTDDVKHHIILYKYTQAGEIVVCRLTHLLTYTVNTMYRIRRTIILFILPVI